MRFLTAEVKGKFISRRSVFYYPDWALTVFYESILANCVASLDFLLFPVQCTTFDCYVGDLQESPRL